MNPGTKDLAKRYGKGVLLSAVLLFSPLPVAPGLVFDVRVWLLFLLGTVLVGTHPPMRFTTLGMDRHSQTDRRSVLFVNLAAYLSFLPLYAHYVANMRQSLPPEWTLGQFAAAAFAIAGITLRVCAIHKLGPWFTAVVTTSQDQELIQNGVYRFIRHPSYLGAMAFWGSLPFLLGLWFWAILTWPLLFLAYLWRIHVEEAALQARFGAAYEEYQRNTSRLIPRLF